MRSRGIRKVNAGYTQGGIHRLDVRFRLRFTWHSERCDIESVVTYARSHLQHRPIRRLDPADNYLFARMERQAEQICTETVARPVRYGIGYGWVRHMDMTTICS